VALVTGASSGLGREIAGRLAEGGYVVFGTGRDPRGCAPDANWAWLPLDVRSEDSAQACVDATLERGGRLDVLVNNAGYVLKGAVEECTSQQFAAVLETNLLGAVRMTRLCLPALRRQRSGHVVNVGSAASLARAPFFAAYVASKCALDGFSEALWHELRPFGIRVSVVQPGFFRTRIAERAESASGCVSDYRPEIERALAAVERSLAQGDAPRRVAQRVWRIVESRRPPLFAIVGAKARCVALLRRVLPATAFARLVRRDLRLDSGARGLP